MTNRPNTVETLRAKCVEEGECLLWQGRVSNHGVPMVRHAVPSAKPKPGAWA